MQDTCIERIVKTVVWPTSATACATRTESVKKTGIVNTSGRRSLSERELVPLATTAPTTTVGGEQALRDDHDDDEQQKTEELQEERAAGVTSPVWCGWGNRGKSELHVNVCMHVGMFEELDGATNEPRGKNPRACGSSSVDSSARAALGWAMGFERAGARSGKR